MGQQVSTGIPTFQDPVIPGGLGRLSPAFQKGISAMSTAWEGTLL